MNGLYKDEKDHLWVVIHLEDEELLEWGEDRNFLKDEFEKINGDYTRLLEFVKKYSDLICAIGDKDD